jgi:hypothetical protein
MEGFSGSIWGPRPTRKEVKDDKVRPVLQTDTDDAVCGSCDICEEAQERKRIQQGVPLEKDAS